MLQSKGYAAQSTTSGLAPFSFERRDPLPDDVVVEIAYCGICHSDIHQVRDEWGGSMYPMVPGHEIVGRVSKVGKNVTRFKEGDLAGVGGDGRFVPRLRELQGAGRALLRKGFRWHV